MSDDYGMGAVFIFMFVASGVAGLGLAAGSYLAFTMLTPLAAGVIVGLFLAFAAVPFLLIAAVGIFDR